MKRFDYSLDEYAMRPKNGTAYKVWRERVGRLMKEKGVPLQIRETDLNKMYYEDLAAWDVYYFIRSQTAKNCIVQILWFDDYGKEECHFTNSDEIRDFLTRCDRLRKLLKNGV